MSTTVGPQGQAPYIPLAEARGLTAPFDKAFALRKLTKQLRAAGQLYTIGSQP